MNGKLIGLSFKVHFKTGCEEVNMVQLRAYYEIWQLQYIFSGLTQVKKYF